jgi:2-oxoglutarate ferredoxin oxidoreductase subunit beta
MTSLAIDEFVENHCGIRPHELKDYETEVPRWCKGCGDHGVLSVIQRLLRDEQVDPENVVAVSGIGCSSRLPHYLKTYGFHGIHGRALPVSLGVALARPDVRVMTVMGDGDCFSIGAGHWVHTLRYNPRILVVVLDNEVYALTKNQVSPTSQAGAITNTTPRGAYLKGMNPLSTILGVTNVSFLAQTASWLPVHMEDTLRKAWHHRGMAFVRILARCPVFLPNAFGADGSIFPAVFLENSEGVPVNKGVLRTAPTEAHDHRDLHAAQRMALREDGAPMGLLYWNPELPSYEEVRWSHTKKLDRAALISAMNAQLDKYSVQ